MKWFKKYLPYFGDYTTVPENVFEQVKNNLRCLEKEQIDVSIAVIAYNEEKNILPCIWSLSEMETNLSVEIIVVNNNSDDRTQDVLSRLGVRNVFQSKSGHGYARQAGLDIARGKYHFSADADVLYPPKYVDTMMKYLTKPKISVVFAPCGFIADGKKSQFSLDLYCIGRDIVIWLRSRRRPALCAGGASMAFYAEQARLIRWRTDIRRGEDGAMVIGLKKFGEPLLVLNKRARIRTSSRRLDSEGTFREMVWKHLKKDLRRINEFFTKETTYKDRPSNMR